MTQALRDAAQALLDALDNYHLHGSQVGGQRRKDRLRAAANSVRAALAAPAPSPDERVAAHMRLVGHYASMFERAMGGGPSHESAGAAVEASTRALLGAAQEDAEMLDWLAANVTEAPMDPKRFEHTEFPDTRLRWMLPMMPSWADYCGQISFKEAVRIAMNAKEAK